MTRTKPVLAVPAVALDSIPRNMPVALFFRGFDRFEEARGDVTLQDDAGNTVDASVLTAQVGRLFPLCAQYQAQNVYAMARMSNSAGAYMGGQFSDTALFDALETGKPADLHPLAAYTVVVVQVTKPVAVAAASAPNPAA